MENIKDTLRMLNIQKQEERSEVSKDKIAEIQNNTIAKVEARLEDVFRKESTSVELWKVFNISSKKIRKLENEATQTLTIDNVMEELERFVHADDYHPLEATG